MGIQRKVHMNDKLAERDYYLLIDKSGSMAESDTPTGQTRFAFAEEFTIALSRKISTYDPDGITVIPFSSSFKKYDGVTEGKVKDVFKENEPMGGTNLSGPLKEVFKEYLANKKDGKAKSNGALCLVVTDGQPNDPQEVAKAIVDFTKQLENGDEEFGIGFLQVGKDAAAKQYLTMLDDNLKGAKFDIVDAKTMDELENLGVDAILDAALSD